MVWAFLFGAVQLVGPQLLHMTIINRQTQVFIWWMASNGLLQIILLFAERLLAWAFLFGQPPDVGRVKLNCDGACRAGEEVMACWAEKKSEACGGIMWEHRSSFVVTYSCNLFLSKVRNIWIRGEAQPLHRNEGPEQICYN